jgi:aspartate aminotransferase/aminotransferase
MMITSGTSGALMLAILATINPGDEVVAADPYFVMYPNMVTLAGGTFVGVDTYPSFAIDPQRFMNACTPRTKMMLLCTPGNPTGAVIDREAQQTLAEFCAKRGILLVSDEIYKAFHYDTPPSCPAEFNPDVLVVEGFGKTYGMTGWRLGYVHGPKVIIDEMMKLQQSTFICAPSMAQWGALAACDFDITGIIADYKQKRDRLVAGLRGAFEFETPGGAFYLFAKAPWGTGTDFVKAGIEKNLLVIPGATFSTKDTHFRISYAATDATIDAGIAILRELAAR